MSDNQKIWVYLSDKEFSAEVEKTITDELVDFLQNWKAHENPLTASYQILHHRFIIIAVNEAEYAASGCSIDKQLKFIKATEAKYGINLLNRLLVAYLHDNKVEVVHSSKIPELLASGAITENTLVFNTALSTGKEFAETWQQPLKNTWLSKFLSKV